MSLLLVMRAHPSTHARRLMMDWPDHHALLRLLAARAHVPEGRPDRGPLARRGRFSWRLYYSNCSSYFP